MPDVEPVELSRSAIAAFGDNRFTSTYLPQRDGGQYRPGSHQERRVCGNLDCARVWTLPWRSRKRPVFEGAWCCTSRCNLALVKAAIQRARADQTLPSQPAHRHRIPMGLVMLAQGWITHPQLRKALDAQRASGEGRIGEWLMSECGVGPQHVTRALGVQWNCPIFGLEGLAPRPMALAMPRHFLEEFGVVPLKVTTSSTLRLGFSEKVDASAAFALEHMCGLKTEAGLLEPLQFAQAQSALKACQSVLSSTETLNGEDDLARRIAAILQQKQPTASRLVRLHRSYWLRLWLEDGTGGPFGTIPRSAEDMWDYVFQIRTMA